MSSVRMFSQSFLDGFTMSGFMTRLRHPDAADSMFAPEPTADQKVDRVIAPKSTHMKIDRKAPAQAPEEAVHGTSR